MYRCRILLILRLPKDIATKAGVLLGKIQNKAFMRCALWKDNVKAAMADFKVVYR